MTKWNSRTRMTKSIKNDYFKFREKCWIQLEMCRKRFGNRRSVNEMSKIASAVWLRDADVDEGEEGEERSKWISGRGQVPELRIALQPSGVYHVCRRRCVHLNMAESRYVNVLAEFSPHPCDPNISITRGCKVCILCLCGVRARRRVERSRKAFYLIVDLT